MSNQDSQFFTIFSTVIGILIAVAILLFALARAVAGGTQKAEIYEDPLYIAQSDKRLEPLVHLAIAGQDNSALAIKADTASANTATLPVPHDGAELYQSVCSTCHAAGIGGAPKAGDHAAWAPRIAEGKQTLYQHALNGYQGKAGVMPAKGGRSDLPDALIEQGVDHLVSLAK